MNKTLVRRVEFLLINTSVPVTQMVEADEVYVTQLTPSLSPMKIQRDRERKLSLFIAANAAAMTGGAIQTFATLDITYGRVPLDAPMDVDGKLTNKVVTTTANDLKQADRVNHTSVGMKEMVTFQPVTPGQQSSVLIELVNYVMHAEIGA